MNYECKNGKTYRTKNGEIKELHGIDINEKLLSEAEKPGNEALKKSIESLQDLPKVKKHNAVFRVLSPFVGVGMGVITGFVICGAIFQKIPRPEEIEKIATIGISAIGGIAGLAIGGIMGHIWTEAFNNTEYYTRVENVVEEVKQLSERNEDIKPEEFLY